MKLKKIKLNALSDYNLESREMNSIMGGERVCSCSCYWANQGGASIEANNMANYRIGPSGGYSSEGCNQFTYSDEEGALYWPEAEHA